MSVRIKAEVIDGKPYYLKETVYGKKYAQSVAKKWRPTRFVRIIPGKKVMRGWYHIYISAKRR